MLKKKKPPETPKQKTGRVFSSNFTKPNITFAASLQDQTQQQRQQEEVASCPEPTSSDERKEISHFWLPLQTVSLKTALKALTVVYQIMKELKDASEVVWR
jgi:deferrochelatase/peroxidase EfeB